MPVQSLPLAVAAMLAAVAGLSSCGGEGRAESQREAEARTFYYEDVFIPFFAADPRRPELFAPNRPGTVSRSFPAQKAPRTLRAFVIGGSVAGCHMEQERFLGEALRDLLAGWKVEVLNGGVPGYDSHRDAMLAREFLSYDPDFLVLMTGHNEGAGSAPQALWVLRCKRRLEAWAWFRALEERLLRHGRLPIPESSPQRLAVLEANLRKLLRQASARRVPVVLCSLPVNYRESPTGAPLAVEPLAFLRGRIRYLRGDLARAERLWEESLPALSVPEQARARSLTLFYLGRCAERLGRPREAERRYGEALDAEPRAGCGPGCRSVLERVAAEEKAVWVDLEGLFRARAGPRLPDLEAFRDKMHWHARYNGLVSLAIADGLMGLESLAGLPWDRERAARLRRLWAPGPGLSDEELLRILGEAVLSIVHADRYLSWQAVVYLERILAERPAWLDDPPALLRRLERLEPEERRRTWGLRPRLEAGISWHAGEARLGRRKYSAALRDFDRALGIDGSLVRVRLSRALAEALAGNPGAARRSLLAGLPRELEAQARVLERALELENQHEARFMRP